MSCGQPFDDEVSCVVNVDNDVFGVQTIASSGNTGDRPCSVGVPSSACSAVSVAETEAPTCYQTLSVGVGDGINDNNNNDEHPMSSCSQSMIW